MLGTVESIHIAKKIDGNLSSLSEAKLVPGKGIVGDRWYREKTDKEGNPVSWGAPKMELTFVEAEQIEQFNAKMGLRVEAHDVRRNIVTRGVSLNDLVGVEFMVGEVGVRGIELCEPCKHLGNRLASDPSNSPVSAPEIIEGLTHRAGLRANIATGGTIRIGDPIIITPKR